MMRNALIFGLFLIVACSSQTFDAGGFNVDGGADGGGGSVLAQAIDPIAPGYSWTYDVTVAGTYPSCSNGSSTGSVTQESTLGGKDAFLVSSFCAGIGSIWYSADGDRVYEWDGSNWLIAIDSPVEDGHTWTTSNVTYVWKKIGSLTVKAGTFADCWEIDAQGAAPYYAATLCRGVGPVKWHVRDTSGNNGYDAELTSKSF